MCLMLSKLRHCALPSVPFCVWFPLAQNTAQFTSHSPACVFWSMRRNEVQAFGLLPAAIYCLAILLRRALQAQLTEIHSLLNGFERCISARGPRTPLAMY